MNNKDQLHDSPRESPNDPKLSDRVGLAGRVPPGETQEQLPEIANARDEKARGMTARSSSLQRIVRRRLFVVRLCKLIPFWLHRMRVFRYGLLRLIQLPLSEVLFLYKLRGSVSSLLSFPCRLELEVERLNNLPAWQDRKRLPDWEERLLEQCDRDWLLHRRSDWIPYSLPT